MACLASALPYGMDKIQVGGSYVEFFVGGFTQSPLRMVSGTNVDFSIGTGQVLTAMPIPEETYYWDFDEMTDMTLTIGGQSVDLLLPTEAPTASWHKIIWFMSNHFPHDTVLPVVLTASARFNKLSNPGGNVLDTTVATKSVTVHCKTYNDLVSWRTTVNAENQPDTSPNSYPTAASLGLGAARPKFTAMKFHVPDAPTLTKSDIVSGANARMKDATGVFAFTHGGTNWVKDSGILDMNSGEINNKVKEDRGPGHPKMNFAMHYDCSMFTSAPSWFNAHFESAGNRFFAGFSNLVWSRLKSGDRTDPLLVPKDDPDKVFDALLSDHANELIQWLSMGSTIESALEAANDAYPPRGKPSESGDGLHLEFPLLDMLIHGDSQSTINEVYRRGDAILSIEMGDMLYGTESPWYVTTR